MMKPEGAKPTAEVQKPPAMDRAYYQSARVLVDDGKEAYRSEHKDDHEKQNVTDLYFGDLNKDALRFSKPDQAVDIAQAAPLLAYTASLMTRKYGPGPSYLEGADKAEFESKTKEAEQLFAKTYEKALPGEGKKKPEQNIKLVGALLSKSGKDSPYFRGLAAGFEVTMNDLKTSGSVENMRKLYPNGLTLQLVSLGDTLEEASIDSRMKLNSGEISQEEYDKMQKGIESAVQAFYFLHQTQETFERADEAEKQKAEKAHEATATKATEDAVIAKLQEKIAKQGGKEEAKEEGKKEIIPKDIDFSKEKDFDGFMKTKTLDEMQKQLTPEVSDKSYAHFLKEVDAAIDSARTVVGSDQNMLVNKKTLGAILGPGVGGAPGAVYQRLYAAKTGEVLTAQKLANMPITEFAKKVFGFDLSKDPKRAAELKKYTNAFM